MDETERARSLAIVNHDGNTHVCDGCGKPVHMLTRPPYEIWGHVEDNSKLCPPRRTYKKYDEPEPECEPRFGYITGEKYCAIHGRAAGWPCKGRTN